jgi:hypothetical protein
MGLQIKTNYKDFDFEMTYNADETDEIPTLSIRAKSKGQEYPSLVEMTHLHAFHMYDYLMSLETNADNKLKLNIRFSTGMNADGKEVWKPWSGNPLEITLEK